MSGLGGRYLCCYVPNRAQQMYYVGRACQMMLAASSTHFEPLLLE